MKASNTFTLIALMLCIAIQGIAQQHIENRIEKEIFLSPDQDALLKSRFKRVKIVRIDLPALYQLSHSKKTDIPVTLSDGRHTWNMVIEENEIRSPDYKREITTDSGRFELPREACGTFKGYANSDPESWVRMNIREHSYSAVICSNNEIYYVELLKKFIKVVDENWVIIYTEDDLVSSDVSCGLTTIMEQMEQNKKRIQPKAEQQIGAAKDNQWMSGGIQSLASGATNNNSNYQPMLSNQAANCRKLEIVTESDYDNYNSSIYRIYFNDMIDNLNNVEPIFLNQYGIKLVLRYQHEWTTSNDPYTLTYLTPTTGGTDRLSQFRNYWNNPNSYFYNNIVKDLGIFYTGINIDGSIVGKAYELGSMSAATAGYQSDDSYMIVQTNTYDAVFGALFWPNAQFTSLTAHELGHIMGATHVTSTTNLMYPSLSSNTNWHSQSISEIGYVLSTSSCQGLLSSRFIIIPFATPTFGGFFNGGEIIIRSSVSNSGFSNFSFQGVDLCNIEGTTTISATGFNAGITIKTAACDNSGL